MKKEQNGRKSLRRLKPIVSCKASKRRRRINELVDLEFLVFCEVFVKLRVFCQPNDNFGAKKRDIF